MRRAARPLLRRSLEASNARDGEMSSGSQPYREILVAHAHLPARHLLDSLAEYLRDDEIETFNCYAGFRVMFAQVAAPADFGSVVAAPVAAH